LNNKPPINLDFVSWRLGEKKNNCTVTPVHQ